MTLGDSVSTSQRRPGKHSAAEIDDEGSIALTMTGTPPRNEEDADEICQRVVRALNRGGATWEPPDREMRVSDVDGFAKNRNGDVLHIQVVRAISEPMVWQSLARTGQVNVQTVAAAAADDILEAIRKKTIYPRGQRRHLLLAIDAGRTPSHTFQPVLDSFRVRHRQTCKSFGFREIWVVGARDDTAWRLDG